MKVFKITAAIILSVAFSTQVFASGESAAALYNHANGFYSKGDFEQAIQFYEQAEKQGAFDARLEYNLGNAYLKKTPPDVGQAILHYERARLISPRDSDLLYNIDFVNSLVKEKAPSGERTYLQMKWEALLSSITTNEAAFILSALYFLIAAFFIIYILNRNDGVKKYLRSAMAILALLALIDAPVLVGKIRGSRMDRSVVVGANTSARSGPGETNPELFRLPAGTVVYGAESRGDWKQVSVPGGLSGWIPTKDSASISPRN